MGWKMIYLARRNPSLAPEQFPQAWREHSALGAGCTNVRDKVLSVTQCSRVLEGAPLPGAATDYDGVNLLVLRDLQAATDIWNDAETLAIMRPDEPRVFSTYDRLEGVVDWKVAALEHKWAGLRTFAPDRAPVFGFAPGAPGFFWCVGQGGFGIQTAPAAADLALRLLLGQIAGEVDPAPYDPSRFG